MKKYLLICLLLSSVSLLAQRPATKAEQDEDARVLKTLSDAMPHEIENWLDEGERSNGESNLKGVSGFYNNTNFATRDIFTHQYTISYRMVNATGEMKKQLDDARARNDFAYVVNASTCEIEVYVNNAVDNFRSNSAFKKISSPVCPNVYRDAAGQEYSIFYIGNNWSLTPAVEVNDDGRGTVSKEYYIKTGLKNKIGTTVQSVMVIIKCNAAVADMFISKIDWNKIRGLIGTGNYKEDLSESELKKYYAEKPVTPVAGANSLSFTYIDKDGVEKNFVASSVKHDLTSCALLRNHNEDPRQLQDAHIDFRITDDKNHDMLFNISLPIIRTTGTVTATESSDGDYQVMWRGNPDANHSFSPVSIEIHLSKWAPVGDFLEGTFSGTATLNDHNDFSTDKPVYTIRNGKFRMRRINDEIK